MRLDSVCVRYGLYMYAVLLGFFVVSSVAACTLVHMYVEKERGGERGSEGERE